MHFLSRAIIADAVILDVRYCRSDPGVEEAGRRVTVKGTEVARLQRYLREKFGTDRLILGPQVRKDGSVEVSLGGEFIGIIYRDEEDGEVSYAFHMAIMEMDLPPG
jgi:hypothetical protein